MFIHRLRTFFLFNPCFVLAVFLALGIALSWQPRRPKVEFDSDRPMEVVGWVTRSPQVLENCLYLELEPLSLEQMQVKFSYPARLAVFIYGSQSRAENFFHPPLAYGEVVRFESYLEEPSFYAIPGVPDYRDSFWRQGFLHQARLKSPLQVSRHIESTRGYRFLDPIFAFAESFESFCRKQFKSDHLKLILALFLGQKKALEESQKNRIRHLGIFHLFVVSGFHISGVALLFHLLFRWLGVPGRLLTLAAVWSYVILVGYQPPVLRAGLMTTVSYLLLSFGLSHRLLNGLGIAALVILISSPISLYTPSFQFSFLCLTAIGLFVLPCSATLQNLGRGISECFTKRVTVKRDPNSRLRRRVRFFLEEKLQFRPYRHSSLAFHLTGRLSGYLLSLVCCSGFIQLCTLPLSLYYSNLWVWTQWFSNLVLVPLFALFVPLCLGLFLIFWLPFGSFLALLLAFYADFLQEAMTQLERFTVVDYMRQPTPLELVAYFLLFLSIYYFPWQGFVRLPKWLVFVSPLILLFFLGQPGSHPAGLLQITMLDVGQGESIHLRYPDGRDALIDTGGFLSPRATSSQRVGRQLLSRYLWTQRTRQLQYVLLTHPHADHTQGYGFIKQAFPIGQVYFHDFLDEYHGPPARRLKAGDRFLIAGVEHRVLHPAEREHHTDPYRDTNNSSLVVLLRFREFSMLFTGDVDSTAEARILPALGPVTVLKVAHHGSHSSNSAALLEIARPEVAVISAGRKNIFGHPAPATLDRLAEAGATVLATPRWGSLRIETNGRHWKLSHYSIDEARFRELQLPTTPFRGPEAAPTFSLQESWIGPSKLNSGN